MPDRGRVGRRGRGAGGSGRARRAAGSSLPLALALVTGAATRFSCSTAPDGATLIVIGVARGPDGTPVTEGTVTVEAHAPACPAAAPRRAVVPLTGVGAYRVTLVPGPAPRTCIRIIGRPGAATRLAPDSTATDLELPPEGTVTLQLDLTLPARS